MQPHLLHLNKLMTHLHSVSFFHWDDSNFTSKLVERCYLAIQPTANADFLVSRIENPKMFLWGRFHRARILGFVNWDSLYVCSSYHVIDYCSFHTLDSSCLQFLVVLFAKSLLYDTLCRQHKFRSLQLLTDGFHVHKIGL